MSQDLHGKSQLAQKAAAAMQNPLGKPTQYAEAYSPSLLYTIKRAEKRDELGGVEHFYGEDIWNAYELSWLGKTGVPKIAIAEIRVPASSPSIVESKSLKLYLNSFNQTRFDSLESVLQTIKKDLSGAVGASIQVHLYCPESFDYFATKTMSGENIDEQSIEIEDFNYNPKLLERAVTRREKADSKQESSQYDEVPVSETLVSHLLKSNCLITSQPDWASIQISYKGEQIDHEKLLRYLVSFRSHNEFHEQCVERIYSDLMQYCQPLELTVYARYTRRGGIDINPWRSNVAERMENIRLTRQ